MNRTTTLSTAAILLLLAAPVAGQEPEAKPQEQPAEAQAGQAEADDADGAPQHEPAGGPQPEPEPEIDRWKVLLDFAFSGAQGNQDLAFFDGGFRLTHLQTELAEFELAARGRTGSEDGNQVAESYRGSLKVDAYPEADWSPFVFGSVERDRFRQLDLRSNLGGGVKHTFLRRPNTLASISVAVLHNREDFRPTELPTSSDGRLSWRFKGQHDFREGVRLENVTFYQPVWDAGGDYVLSSAVQLGVKLFSALAVTAAYEYERDSTPAPEVQPDDHYVKVGVQVQI